MLNDDDIQRLCQGRHGDPFSVLGPHRQADGRTWVRAFLPGAAAVAAVAGSGQRWRWHQRHADGLFEGPLPGRRPLPPAGDAGQAAATRCSTTPTASAPCSARWTPGCWPKARTCGPTRCWAPRRARWTAWPAPASPSGRPTRRASAWSATSTTGTAAATRCGCAASAASGNSSCPACTPASATSSSCSTATAALLPQKADPFARQAELRPATASVVAAMPPVAPPSRRRARRPMRWTRR